MAVSDLDTYALYNGNGVTDTFAINFARQANTQVLVKLFNTTTLVETTWTLGVEYTIVSNNVVAGGAYIPATGYQLRIYRNTSLTQAYEFDNNGTPQSERMESALDILLMMIQELQLGVRRALKLNIVDDGSDADLPELEDDSVPIYDVGTDTWDWIARTDLVGATGATGPAGSNGTNGTDGNTVLNGSGAPGGGTGVDGDFYIDTATDEIYGPKSGGVWGSGTSLIGPTGATGAAGASGLITALDTAIGATPTAAGMSESGGTLTLQPANGTHGGVVSNTTQSFLGVKTFINNLLASADIIISGFLKRSNTATITAFAGGGQGSATALATDYNRVTTVATTGDSVKLPTGVAGQKIVVVNDGANDCDVFPFSGQAIDALGTDTAYSLVAGTNITFICIATGVWKTAGGAAGSVSPLTTKGDLWGFSTVDARLPVGTNRYMLESDSTQTLGVGWVSRNQIFGSTGTPRSVVAATGIVSASSHMSTTAMVQTAFIEGSIAGESDVSANPQVENGTVVGQIMYLIGANDANYVKLETGNGLRLNGEWFSYSGAVLTLMWNGTVWTEIGRVA